VLLQLPPVRLSDPCPSTHLRISRHPPRNPTATHSPTLSHAPSCVQVINDKQAIQIGGFVEVGLSDQDKRDGVASIRSVNTPVDFDGVAATRKGAVPGACKTDCGCDAADGGVLCVQVAVCRWRKPSGSCKADDA
jgi:hypothetical protein